MPTIMHEWQCPKCKRTMWRRTKPPAPGTFIYRGYICRPCAAPMKGTGKTWKKFSAKELL
jgi:hypothetical protein